MHHLCFPIKGRHVDVTDKTEHYHLVVIGFQQLTCLHSNQPGRLDQVYTNGNQQYISSVLPTWNAHGSPIDTVQNIGSHISYWSKQFHSKFCTDKLDSTLKVFQNVKSVSKVKVKVWLFQKLQFSSGVSIIIIKEYYRNVMDLP